MVTVSYAETKKRRLWEKARRKAVRVGERLGFYCYWCGVPLVKVNTLPPESVIKLESGKVYYTKKVNGAVAQGWDYFMTIDHVQPISEGGKSNIDNLVPSCEPCNIGRKKGDNRVESA